MTDQILRVGNPLLRTRSKEVSLEEFGSNELKQMSDDILQSMADNKGLGLAAPQIGINKRIIAFGMEKHPRLPDLEPIPFTVICNPSFMPLSDIIENDYEGCLSVGELRAVVPRYKDIVYEGFDIYGHKISIKASGLHARVFQHELDHLDGIIFMDRVNNMLSLGFHSELVASGAL